MFLDYFSPIYLSVFNLFGVPLYVGGNLTEGGQIFHYLFAFQKTFFTFAVELIHFIMSKRKHTYHVICDCCYVTFSGDYLPISRIGGIVVSFNGIIGSDVSMKDTSIVLEYRICRSHRIRLAIPPFMYGRIRFKMTFISRNLKSYVTYFPYRFISE